MSDDLQKRIDLLEKKLAREKKARLNAESQLEDYSRQIYYSNQSLQKSLSKSQKRESELEYLATVSSNATSDLTVKELVVSIVELTGAFSQADCALHLVTAGEERAEGSAQLIWLKERQDWVKNPGLVEQIVESLPLNESDTDENWIVAPADIQDPDTGTNYHWLIFLTFPLFSHRTGWLIFLSSAEYLDEETLYVLETAKGNLLSGIRRRVTDIRVLKRSVELHDAVAKLEQAQQQLVQSEKMASLGQLSAGVAHEINNPLGYIKSNMDTLQEYIGQLFQWQQDVADLCGQKGQLSKQEFDDLSEQIEMDYIRDDLNDLLTSTSEGVERVRDIVADLKAFSHSGEEGFEDLDLLVCLESALKIAWNSLKYDYQVEKQLPEKVPVIQGSPGQLQQVFVNLMVNAGQAMEQGGTLSIRLEVLKGQILVGIKDTGCGMDRETLDKLFTPFFTTKPVGVGTGLGLSVSYAIIEAHSARVEVESEVGTGTEFLLYFPIG